VFEPARNPMTSDGFVAWAMEQPETSHDELVAGKMVPVAPERAALSPATSSRDLGAKLDDHVRLPSVRHCLIVRAENRTVIHHEHGENGVILTRIVRDGPILLEPPGITPAGCFPPGAA
jgi:hypothetical protein